MIDWVSISNLLQTANFTDDEKDQINSRLMFLESDWNEFTEIEYQSIIESIFKNQLIPGLEYIPTSQKMICKAVKLRCLRDDN